MVGLLLVVLALVGSAAPARGLAATSGPEVTCAEISQIPLAECQALAALYTGTGGAQWYDHTGWMATTTPCSWYGVTCEAGRVTGLNLEDNNLAGPLPGQMSNLAQAREFLLLHNRLTGNVPASWSALTSLVVLDLSDNRLAGAIPTQLGALSALQTLNLADNQFSGAIPPELANLTTLQVLNLGANDLTGSVPAWLSSLGNLRELLLANNQLSGTIPAQLAGLAQLQRLVLANNGLTGAIPPELGNIGSLRDLVLASNALSGAIPSELGGAGQLRVLVLSRNQLTGAIPTSLGTLSNLQELWLNSNALQGAVPESLCSLADLSQLDLGYNALVTAPACIDAIDQFWRETQTAPPTNVQASPLTGTSVRLSWVPIPYVADGGSYEVSYRPSGGSWTVAGNTPNKSTASLTVTGLSPRTSYEFRVRTYTPAHNTPPAFQQNAIWSETVSVAAQTPWSLLQRLLFPAARVR